MKLNALYFSTSCIILVAMMMPLQLKADTITIGKGSGIVWEGYPFSETLSGPLSDEAFDTVLGLIAISTQAGHCMANESLVSIAGYKAFPISMNLGLIPRATGSAQFGLLDGETGTLTGTIGLPETSATSSTVGKITNFRRAWCLTPEMISKEHYYNKRFNRTSTLSGTWALVANGNQTSAEIKLPRLYFASFSKVREGDRFTVIFPTNITLRVSALECTVSTPTTINFGNVVRNVKPKIELAKSSVSLTTSCGQSSDKINANINVQFRALTGFFNGVPSQLALKQGGGYITGEIDNGATGSGACNSSAGVNFDSRPIKLGQINNSESIKVLNNQLTWRLCSGGNSLPSGAVDAATEMMVTFN